ncbi:MAG: hypothetical protein RI531_08760, partial [Haloferacaceae archaeon]|nr:hypothetical protein [Haloferacaceae archaeon]
MIVELLVALAFLTAAATWIAMTTSTDQTAIIAGIIGSTAGGVAAIGAFNVEVVTDSGAMSVGAEPGIAMLLVGARAAAGRTTTQLSCSRLGD